jgi:hypothetical protein
MRNAAAASSKASNHCLSTCGYFLQGFTANLTVDLDRLF